MKLTTILVAVSSLLVVGCAKPVPPPAPVVIPVQLVNIQKVDITVPDLPSDKKLVRISKNDPADEALADVLDYTSDLKGVAKYALTELRACKVEMEERDARLEKIKQYILLNQAQTQ